MKSKDLKRLSRSDLLEMMLALSKENEQLRSENAQLRKQTEDRSIAVENAGSLAEASLQLSGVFEAAQAACDRYMENIRYRTQHQEEICERMERETREKCDRMEQEAALRCERILTEARKNAREILLEARRKAAQQDDYSWLTELLENDQSKESK